MINTEQYAYRLKSQSSRNQAAAFEELLSGLFPISDCRIDLIVEDSIINHIKAGSKYRLQHESGRVIIPLEHKFNLVGMLGFRINEDLSGEQLNHLNKVATLLAGLIYHMRVCRLLESEVRRLNSRKKAPGGVELFDRHSIHVDRMRSLKQLAGGLAHELNNLLCAIIGTAEFACNSGDMQECQAALRTVIMVAEMAGDIVNKLFKFSGSQMPAKDLGRLTEPVDKALAILEDEILRRGVIVKKSILESPKLYFDGEMIVQVMLSLIQNALEEMEQGGTLSISLGSDREFAVIRLRDTGRGLADLSAEAESMQIFEPFFSTKGVLAGGKLKCLGLGLSIAHGLIESHGGEIGVEYSPNGSLEFLVRLPLKTIA